MIRFLKRFIRVVVALSRINWFQFFRLHQSSAKVAVWIVKPALSYLGSDTFVKDTGLVRGLIQEQIPFKLRLGKNVGSLFNHTIFYTLNDTYNIFGFADYTAVLNYITTALEQQGNRICPSSYEAAFWENKAFMHKVFREKGVSEPVTRMHTKGTDALQASVNFPFLIKAEHSCSSKGLYKINSRDELESLFEKTNFLRENDTIIIQELVPMRKDLRVILVDGEIVLHYWRINTSKEWKPTSTSYGSEVDFVFFPEHWRQHMLDTFKKLNLTTGAFDITWANDDLNTEPLYLEVSPVFQPNPVMTNTKKHYAYYKKRVSFTNSWDAAYVRIVQKIKHLEVKAYLKKGQHTG